MYIYTESKNLHILNGQVYNSTYTKILLQSTDHYIPINWLYDKTVLTPKLSLPF